MDLKILEQIFKFGNFVSLTPPSIKIQNQNKHQKSYTFLICAIHSTLQTVLVCYTWPMYSKFSAIQFILVLFSTALIYLYGIYIFACSTIYKQTQWYKIIEVLDRTNPSKKRTKVYFFVFTTSQIFVLLFGSFGSYLYWNGFGLRGCLVNSFEYFQIYIYVNSIVLRCIICDMFKLRYQQQVSTLKKSSSDNVISMVKQNILLLNDGVRNANSVFGLPILFNIFCCSLKTLIWFDILLKNDGSFRITHSVINVLVNLYQTSGVLLSWVKFLFVDSFAQ